MKKILKTSLISLLLIILVSFGTSNILAETEMIELDYYYYETNEKVQIPRYYETRESEMRGAWVATVFNLDFKKQSGTNQSAIDGFKKQFLTVLDTIQSYNMNTIFFQVRPCNDAFYASKINPWSEFLVNAGTDPGWDPLSWMVEETHNRGMEFQCWMNAFRTTVGSILPDGKIARNYNTEELLAYKKSALNNMASNNYAKLHPESVLLGSEDCRLILNPGDLGVQQHIVDTIKEIVENYDVDGVHFDDYFYLNASIHSETYNANFAGGDTYDPDLTGESILNDLPTYEDYKANPSKYDMQAGLNLGDFRRNSINNMMKKIRIMIDKYNLDNNDDVEYGSKPAAVWQSSTESCHDESNGIDGGSNNVCGAYASNYNLYADTKHWVEEGYVDWVAPQAYYDFENREVPYADIVSWWAKVVTAVNEKRAAENKKPIKMYVAHGIYLYDESDTRYTQALEIQRQLKFNQMFDCIVGSAVYDYTTLATQKKSVTRAGMNFLKATWDSKVFSLPRGADDIGSTKIGENRLIKTADETVRISFEKLQNVKGYALYKVNKGEKLTFDIENRVDIFYELYKDGGKTSFIIKDYDQNCDYYIRAVSLTNHLSSEATKVTSTVSDNSAPSSVNVVYNNGQNAILLSNVTAFIPYSDDIDGDVLTYEVKVSVNGKDGRYYNVDSIEYGTDGITIKWEAYLESDDSVIKVEISDGDLITTCYSNSIKIAETFDPIDPDPIVTEKTCEEDPTQEKCQTPEPVEEPKKGCKKSASLIAIVNIIVVALGIMTIRRKH